MGSTGNAVPEDTITCTQVHGAGVVSVSGLPARAACGEGDALITATPNTCVAVRTADCLPILLHSPDGAVVAAVHAGWRGSVAQVAVAAVRALQQHHGITPTDLSAHFGPAIRPCCYQVGDELIDAITNHFPEWAKRLLSQRPDGCYFDLAELNRLQLQRIGVGAIADAGICTCCDPAKHESYRRDGSNSGRMISWIRSSSS